MIKQIYVRTNKFPLKGGWLEVDLAEVRVEFENGHVELTVKRDRK